ncbi:hypothetical protein CBR_g49575 [Chara braunii]|uniref:Uncharacterized protein n=1 Tax=Chara braunii TaxID=69332 RepID=A0A388M5H7_CHABU|nr:hypothetical protein CBR_g49575 [Chara braunii]|eukprot:GBG89722.1 hypothetical protein CBR_g49575 [Chara braunii]
MIDEATVMDDRQRLQTMAELNKVGQSEEQAFLENRRAREEARRTEAKGGKEEDGGDSVQESKTGSKSRRMREEESVGEEGDGVTGSEDKGGESSASLKGKITDRDSAKGDSSYQGSKRAYSGKGNDGLSSEGEKDQDDAMKEKGKEDQGSQGEEMKVTTSSEGTSTTASTDQRTDQGPAIGRVRSTKASSPEVSKNTAQDLGGKTVEGEGKMAQDSDRDLDRDSDKRQDDWEEEEEEEEDEPETLAQWIKHVHKLKWERHIECEIRLAHHKHLRNLKQATAAGEDITTANKFERLKNEQDVNEFYATQYGMKARLDKNDIMVHNAGYAKQFIWPKSYQPQGLKRAEQKRRAQQQQLEFSGSRDQDLSDSTQGVGVDEPMEEEKRQAVILEAQLKVLKEQNSELGEDTINLQKIAYAPHADINAAAKLYARQDPGKRIVLPYRWNSGNADWEVAIHRSLALITVKDSHCEHVILKEHITKDLPLKAHVIGDLNRDREEWEDTEGTKHMLDYRPVMIKLQEKAVLTDGFIWMPWQVVETIPYGLLGGSEAAEWVARGAAIVTKSDVFAWQPDYIDGKIDIVATTIEWTRTRC